MQASPFHSGELLVQQHVGETTLAVRNGRIISDTIMAGALQFLENQPFVIVSSQHESGDSWTSMISGQEGYIRVVSDRVIEINYSLIHSNRQDLFWELSKRHPFIGMLFIELTTRRRFRLNGRITRAADRLTIQVEQAYPNCPKYIQRRQIRLGASPVYSALPVAGTVLNEELIEWIGKADTFFVGSSNESGQMDASHRGGDPGFVNVLDASTLQIPDYSGNSMYNTLGNFVVNPKASLLFVDFERGRTLQLTGTADIIWQAADAEEATGGTRRFWTFSVNQWVILENLTQADWHLIDYSPFNP